MSAALDVNVLLYASDESSPFNGRARAFLADRGRSPDLLYLWWGTVMSYLRIATHHGIFQKPLSAREASANISALLQLPQTRLLHEEEDFWQAYQEVVRDVPTRGNLVPDAHLATVLRQHGVKTLYTADNDFRKFSFLDVRNPLIE
jgi:uncharacterized protein